MKWVLWGAGLVVVLAAALVALAFYNLTSEHPIEIISRGSPKLDARVSGALGQRFDIKAPKADDAFGSALRISGDALVVGAPLNDDAGQDAGRAYVYRRKAGQWLLEAPLAPAHPDPGDRFGSSVAISGDRLVVSAPHEASAATQIDGDATNNGRFHVGAAYVFEHRDGTWQQTAYLKTSNVRNADDFGSAMDVDGDVVAIGAPQEAAPGLMHPEQYPTSDPRSKQPAEHSDAANWAGAVHVFHHGAKGWVEEPRLVPKEHESGLEFGSEVEVDGDTVAVSCGRSEFYRGGHVYVFHRVDGVWTQEAHLTSPSPAAAPTADRFGQSISLHGDLLAVGSQHGDPLGNGPPPSDDPGRVFIYERKADVWQLRDQIGAVHGGPAFATRVALGGDVLLASSPDDGEVDLLTRVADSWKPSGVVGSSSSRWSRLDYDPASRTFATATDVGISVLTVR